jgi:hypothetical protein
MGKISQRMRLGRRREETGKAPAVEVGKAAEPVELPAPERSGQGLDARRLAEEKAEAAGRKWRAAAEARGEVPKETGGPKGLEPTRYGDWEKAGRCFDF